MAATLAWLMVQPFGGLADSYPYYAPLGAVVAVTATVIGSVRESLQTIAAISIGVILAGASTPLPQLPSLLLVVALGTVATVHPAFRWLGPAARWAPITGMFVLIIGGDSPWEYATAYVILTSFGALVGLTVNALWPPLPLRAEQRQLDQARDRLADRLDSVADGLDGDGPPTLSEWTARADGVEPLVDELRSLAGQAHDARRGNWRLKRWGDDAFRRYQQARALERSAFLVEDLVELLRDQEHADREHVALGPTLRPYAARVLGALADVLRTGGADDEDEARLAAADRAIDDLVQAMRAVRRDTGDDLITAGAVVTGAGRTLTALTDPRPGG